MPIKFRCNYCRQFLGISRAQAGGVVDCPTCGQSIRVPLTDGTVPSVEAPELDQEDTHLSRALDELAKLVDLPVQQFVPVLASSQADPDDAASENQIPQPLPEPIPIELPLPPTPVVVVPPVNASLAGDSPRDLMGEPGLLDELTALSARAAVFEQPEAAIEKSLTVRSTSRSDLSALALSILVASTFLAGMLTERFVRLFELGWPGRLHSSALPQPNIIDSELTGRILYKTSEGESHADRGARLVLFPMERSGTVKLSSVGFRPADGPADQLVANAAIKALGGTAASADERGEFRVVVEAGSYQLLILSHYQSRPETEVDPSLAKLLLEYFDKPVEVLGRVQYQFSPIRIKGTGDQWDHSF